MKITVVLFLLLFCLCYLKLRIEVMWEDGEISVAAKLRKITVFRVKFLLRPGTGVYREKKKVCERVILKKKRRAEKHLKRILRAFLRAYRAEKVHMDILVGLDDAAQTAYVTGILRILLKNAICAGRLFCEDYRLQVAPEFSCRTLKIRLHCIIVFRIADIIRNMIYRKGGKKHVSNRKHIEKYDV